MVDNPQLPRVIDRYVLYDAIASGGMATVHLGRLLGSAGFSRLVAIKRLHDFLAIDPEFLAMFLDEARVAARVRHPNVVPSIDVVSLDQEAFLIMEYVPGEPFSYFLRIARTKATFVPFKFAVHIMAGALRGLHAAHEAKNEKGQPLGIVHRDVSPQNILVGDDGVARVMDFGVAKAIGRVQTTREGQIKGKISYMAPEHITGKGVSASSDIFSAAIVLWEALAGQRLFAAENDVEAMYNILERKIEPPSQFNPDLPPGLDEIVLRGLARDPADRYPTALAMAEALEQSCPAVAPAAVGAWVQEQASEPLAAKARLVERIEQDVEFELPPASSTALRISPPSVPTRVESPSRMLPAIRSPLPPPPEPSRAMPRPESPSRALPAVRLPPPDATSRVLPRPETASRVLPRPLPPPPLPSPVTPPELPVTTPDALVPAPVPSLTSTSLATPAQPRDRRVLPVTLGALLFGAVLGAFLLSMRTSQLHGSQLTNATTTASAPSELTSAAPVASATSNPPSASSQPPAVLDISSLPSAALVPVAKGRVPAGKSAAPGKAALPPPPPTPPQGGDDGRLFRRD